MKFDSFKEFFEGNLEKFTTFWENNKEVIYISIAFILATLVLLLLLGFLTRGDRKAKKKPLISSALLLLVFVGVNYLLIENIDKPTVLEFSENLSVTISATFRLVIIDIALLSLYTILVVQLFKQKQKKVVTTSNVATIGILVSVASVLMLFGIPIFPTASFLKLEVSGLIIFMVFIWFDVKTALTVSFLTNIIHVFMPGVSTPIILFLDEFVNFIATVSFLLPSILLIKKDENNKVLKGRMIPIAVLIGIAFTTVFMTLYNFFFNLPIVYLMLDWDLKSVAITFGSFNIIKWGSVGFLIIVLWKKLEPLMHIRNN